MFFLGIVIAVVGAAARNIGLAPAEIGLLISTQNFGFVLGVLTAGALADSLRKPRLMLAGSLLLAVSFATFYLSPLFAINLVIMFVMGSGIGIYEGVSDAMLLEIHDRHESLYINVNHAFVTLGSLAVTTYLIYLQMSWRRSMLQAAVAVAALALLFAFVRVEGRAVQHTRLSQRLRFLIQPPFLVAFLLLLAAAGAQLAHLGIMTTYLMQLRGFDQVTSKLVVVTLLGGIGFGRIVVGFLTRSGKVFGALVLLFGLTTLGSASFFLVRAEAALYGIAFLTGLTISGLMPLLITIVGLVYRDSAGTALGVMKLAIPFGGILVPLVFSAFSEILPLQRAVLVLPLFFGTGFVGSLAALRLYRRSAVT
jgi:MFS family permease